MCYRNIHFFLQEIERLGKRARQWGVRFQPVKCNMNRFSKKSENIVFDYTLEEASSAFHDEIKHLGVNITIDLN